MNKSNKQYLEELKRSIEIDSTVDDQENINTKPNTFEQKVLSTKEIMSGTKVKTPRLLVETKDCVLWEKHNRNFDLLNEIKCASLINRFKEIGKQAFPAIVRNKQIAGKNKYEIICGARRFWVATYLGWKFFVEVRDLSDEEAFRLSDIENRDREDISDYERAVDYKNALPIYYTSQAQMAERLEVSTPWLSRFLYLADLPQEIISAYKDITQIKVNHGRQLKPFLSEPKKHKKIIDKIFDKAKSINGKDLTGEQVIKELLSVTKEKQTRGAYAKTYQSVDGNVELSVKKNRDKKIHLIVDIKSHNANSKNELIDLIIKNIDSYL